MFYDYHNEESYFSSEELEYNSVDSLISEYDAAGYDYLDDFIV